MKIANGIWGFAALAVFHSGLSAQVNITPTLDLGLGVLGSGGIRMVEIPGIGSAVVFRTLPHTSMCPTARPGDFELKRLNPEAGRATTEYIRGMCMGVDSLAINTEVVWEIQTSLSGVYYMQLLELVDKKVKVRITSEKPAVVLVKRAKPAAEGSHGGEYLVNGRSPSSSDAPSGATKSPNFLIGPMGKQ